MIFSSRDGMTSDPPTYAALPSWLLGLGIVCRGISLLYSLPNSSASWNQPPISTRSKLRSMEHSSLRPNSLGLQSLVIFIM